MLDSGCLPIRGDRAVLRTMRPADASFYVSGTADPTVRRFAHLPEPEYTEASVTAMIDGAVRDGLDRGDLAVLTVADPVTDVFAGSLVFFGVEQGSAEVGFWVHPDHRGKGVARATLALGVAFARCSGFVRLTARTLPENHASQHVLERARFIKGATIRDIAPSGHEVELIHYRCDIDP